MSNVRVADPFWAGEITTVALENNELAEWEAFIQDCVDRNLSIDFLHPLHRCPSAYNPSSYPGSGTGSVTSIVDGRTIEVSGLATGLVLRKGDRLSIEQDDRVMHYMVGEAKTLGSSPEDIVITPRLREGLFTTGATVRFLNPKMRLKITPNSYKGPLAAGAATYVQFSVYESPL